LSEHVCSGSKQSTPTGLPLIKCECGEEILLVPDAKVMGKCIEAHVKSHTETIKDQKKAQLEADRIRNLLVAQILKKAAEQSKRGK
jgi:hypothetical protein